MYSKYIKRLLDIIISLILIVLLSPLIVITLILTLIFLGLPIYNFKREREGLNKKIFIMYKFRTKTKKQTYSKKDEYNTVPRIIDKLRLNELPQLFNVLKGDMSIVGPRPFIPGEKLPEGKISEKRYLVKPGITGLAQINGDRMISHKQKLKYDEIYYDNLSFKLDLVIFLKTPIAIIKNF